MCKCFTVFLRVTRFAPPMSRRQVTNRRELFLPLLRPDRHQIPAVFDSSVSPVKAMNNGQAGEPPGGWTRHSTHYRAAKRASQTAEVATPVATPELIAGNHILARLVFQRIRPHNHAGTIGGQSCPKEPQHARPLITPPDMASPPRGCAEVPTSASAPPIETLFTQLARRRLRSRAAKETR